MKGIRRLQQLFSYRLIGKFCPWFTTGWKKPPSWWQGKLLKRQLCTTFPFSAATIISRTNSEIPKHLHQKTHTYSAKGPWNKRLNFVCPTKITKYVIPKSFFRLAIGWVSTYFGEKTLPETNIKFAIANGWLEGPGFSFQGRCWSEGPEKQACETSPFSTNCTKFGAKTGLVQLVVMRNGVLGCWGSDWLLVETSFYLKYCLFRFLDTQERSFKQWICVFLTNWIYKWVRVQLWRNWHGSTLSHQNWSSLKNEKNISESLWYIDSISLSSSPNLFLFTLWHKLTSLHKIDIIILILLWEKTHLIQQPTNN